ncbi:hypothetical protein RHGRI_000176 [Rhododendron griersonianum]|uniref:DUF4220 domain-containing protein n=1 Tax=Rhododendron griersonianum TaxID=479676 RepID=A0AAV6LGQ4_9ERIC|nr:hypothetical protein RHGRI_000176 [Rhododendron griersonianum]
MGLVVQLSAVIYVILMSWKKSWFSFMSLPALVAGVIKYGERTLVLKWVSDEKYLHRRPYGSLSDKYPTKGHDYVRVLVVAYEHLDRFMWYLDQGGGTLGATDDGWANHWDSMEANILWDALGVQMGLMYDLLYTKAAVIYSKRGFIMRCISFGCTVNVLLGLTIQIVLLKAREEEDDEENYWHEIDIAITGLRHDDEPQSHDDEPQIDPRLISDSLTSELREIWAIVADRDAQGGQDDPYGSDSLWKQNREVSKALSDYMIDKENKSGTEDESVPRFAESKDVKLDLILADRMANNQNDDIVQDEVPDEGWQEAFPEDWVATVALGKLSDVLGLTIQIVLLKTREEEKWHEVDVAITGVLIVGAVALEIYAAIVIFSSNWMMLWLIAQVGEKTDVQSPSTKRIRSVLRRKCEEKWNRYQHKTAYSIHPRVYDVLSEIFVSSIDARTSANIISQSDEIWGLLRLATSHSVITGMHLVTEMCYRLEKEWDGGGEDDPSGSDSSSWKQYREVSKTLSDYMMYLLTMHHSLLPNVGTLLYLEKHTLSSRDYPIIRNARDVDDVRRLLRNARDIDGVRRLLRNARDLDDARRLLRNARDLDVTKSMDRDLMKYKKEEIFISIASRLQEKEKPERWEIIKQTWLTILLDLTRADTGYGQKNSHFQKLRQGGELITLIWFINPRKHPGAVICFLSDSDS